MSIYLLNFKERYLVNCRVGLGLNESELLKKYSVPAPRYTSYPTVPFWDGTPTEPEWLAHLQKAISESRETDTGAALYIHVPFCEALCTFCGCNTRITKNHQVAELYIDKIHKEWRMYLEGLQCVNGLNVAELHLGGGTPTFFSSEELEALVEPILVRATPEHPREYTLEVDPRSVTKEQLSVLANLGFNCATIGIQDFDERVQIAVNRIQPVDQVRRVTDWVRELGYTRITYELIYGLPLQTEASINAMFEEVFKLSPDRVAFYPYAHVPWIRPSQRKFSEKDLPQGTAKQHLHEVGRRLLADAGFEELGMDYYVKSTDKLWQASQTGDLHRNFMGYSLRQSMPLIGLGVSAISDAGTAYMQNEKVLEKYYARLDEGELPLLRGHRLTDEDLTIRNHILNLTTSFQTSWLDSEIQLPVIANLPKKVRELERDGLLRIKDQSLEVLPAGRRYLRNIAMAFDARLAKKWPNAELFIKSS